MDPKAANEPGEEEGKDVTPATTEASKTVEAEVEYPDPDEDDLDDLDDMLDDFSAVKIDQKAGAAQPKAPTPAAAEPPPAGSQPASSSGAGPQPKIDGSFSEEDFAKELQAGMADLLGELEKSPDMQAQFENIFNQINAAAAEAEQDPTTEAPTASSKPAQAATPKKAGATGEASFQDTIRATMERMQNSGDQATAAATSDTGADDFMSEMLKSLSSGDFNPDGSEEDFSKMLMGMMEQLTNKDILYEPMKELHDKFPGWMEKNKSSTSEEDMTRYKTQQEVVAEIVAKFEESTYSDSNTADREYIVDRMQKMQAQGSPPSDLVGDMASAQEAFGGVDDQCNPQ